MTKQFELSLGQVRIDTQTNQIAYMDTELICLEDGEEILFDTGEWIEVTEPNQKAQLLVEMLERNL